ncbi:GCN5 family acetyltransferase [Rhodanobacter sp. B04]|nr:GCN5 family acetyltransferase [Rhodanobacter sp. B04]
MEAFSPASADHSVSAVSRYPNAVVPAKVGTYSGPAKSGAGYFYDEVLEYRVWLHPEKGAKPLAGDKDYFAAFAQYESALKFSETTPGAEPPLALVRQIESINEPSPGVYEWTKEERITEWQVEWLLDSHREPDSISKFLSKHGSPGK